MNQQDIQYFILIIPGCLLLLGIAFIVCRLMLPDQKFLSWIAAGYIPPSLALGAQSMMSNQQLADWAVITATFYLFGIWSIAHGMALRNGGSAYPKAAILIGAIILSLLFYYSQIVDNLWLRIIILNTGLGLMQLLVARQFLKKSVADDLFDRVLRLSYIVIIVYTLARPIFFVAFVSPDALGELTKSRFWLVMLAAGILLSLWLALVIFAITVRDIVLQMNKERYYDALTNLLNRRGFFEAAKTFMNEDTNSNYFLLACDVDHFKSVNDNWGHLAGDRVLQEVSNTVVKSVRDGDLVARFGGEELVILLRCTDTADALSVAERIRREIETTTFTVMPSRVTASFGLVDILASDDLVKAIGRADALLYTAKQNGRNQVCFR